MACQALSGTGMVRLVVWPPRNRTCRWMFSVVLLMVTSSMSKRAIRFRSRCGVAGFFHRAGKSVARARIRARCSSVSAPCAATAWS